jgi:hypothetical protein
MVKPEMYAQSNKMQLTAKQKQNRGRQQDWTLAGD